MLAFFLSVCLSCSVVCMVYHVAGEYNMVCRLIWQVGEGSAEWNLANSFVMMSLQFLMGGVLYQYQLLILTCVREDGNV